MSVLAFDTETHLLKPGMGAPKMVCLSLAEEGGTGERGSGWVLDRVDGLAYMRKALTDDRLIVGHHTPYDLGILCAEDPKLIHDVYAKIDAGLCADTLLRQKIIQNALGTLKYEWDDDLQEYKAQRFGLAYVASRLLGRYRDKGEDTWRLRYRELDGVPISEWPEDARLYAEWDAEDTMAMYLHQHELEPNIVGEKWQMEAAWALHLTGVWGLRTDAERVARIKANFIREWEAQIEIAQRYGFVRTDAKRSKDTKAISEAVCKWCEENETEVPETPTGKVSLKKDVLAATDHPGLQAVAEMGKWRKLLTTYIPVLEGGTVTPINPSYNAILETYRTSCARPNIQNLPGRGGIRECFVPREGWLYGFCDYDTLEMRSLAQVCLWLFGFSAMAEALCRKGSPAPDLHVEMAAEIMGIAAADAYMRLASGDKDVKTFRKHAKPANFGFPGGMGPRKFIQYAAGYGVELTYEQAKQLRDTFMTKWPEMEQYFAYCAGLVTGDTAPVVEFLGSKMLRGDVMYTAVCNGFFQHLAAMGAKRACYEVTRACYTLKDSPLHGCRLIAFVHDELGIEIPPWVDSHAASKELERIMIKCMAEWIPDIPITCSTALMRRWYKGADPVTIDGRLVPCKPDGDGGWIPDLDTP